MEQSLLSPALKAIKSLPLGRRLALRFWNRFERLRGEREVVTYFGSKIACDPIDIIQATITHFGVWEPNVSRLVEQVVRPGDLVADIGANVGYFSLLLSKLVGTGGRVISVEAHPRLSAAIEANAKRNDVNNITVKHCAVAAVRGELTLYEAPKSNIGMTTVHSKRGFAEIGKVDARTLMELLSGENLRRLAFIKCDIEGAEVPVLREVLDNLHSFSPRLSLAVEANDGPEWEELFARFRGLGFRAFQIPNDLTTFWGDMLRETAEAPWREVTDIPANVSDLFLTRQAVPADALHENGRKVFRARADTGYCIQ